ncbi:MAG TPA: DNA repair protein RadA, partial [Burkholderiaceae bacterium]|nr:DNA repair protein RadA [Burkholderiaceae bacterium]
MARPKTQYVCTDCGGISPKWSGQCPHCSAWNTLQETAADDKAATRNRFASLAPTAGVQTLGSVATESIDRLPTGSEEFDRV